MARIERLGKEVLPAFSSAEAAGRFLSSQVLGEGWYVRQFSSGELVSLLFGLYGRVGRVLSPAGSSLGRRCAVVPGEPGPLHRVLDRRLIATEALLTTRLRVALAHPNLVPRPRNAATHRAVAFVA